MKILITGGNHAKALKVLKAFPTHFVLLADYGEVPSIKAENYAFASLGELNKDSIAHILLNFCITESIDSIIPLYDFELAPLAKSSVLFNEYDIQVLLPPANKLSSHLSNDAVTFAGFAVFINGESIYASVELKNTEKDLNGIYATDGESFKLFTI